MSRTGPLAAAVLVPAPAACGGNRDGGAGAPVRRIAFTVNEDGYGEIWIMDVEPAWAEAL